MARERDLALAREDPKPELRAGEGRREEKRRGGVVHLAREELQGVVVETGRIREHRERVAGERAVREHVDEDVPDLQVRRAASRSTSRSPVVVPSRFQSATSRANAAESGCSQARAAKRERASAGDVGTVARDGCSRASPLEATTRMSPGWVSAAAVAPAGNGTGRPSRRRAGSGAPLAARRRRPPSHRAAETAQPGPADAAASTTSCGGWEARRRRPACSPVSRGAKEASGSPSGSRRRDARPSGAAWT